VIVEVYDVDAAGDAPAIVMELVDGESLAARVAREGPVPATEAARIAADIADALYHAHQRGLVHRDVKPGNVLLSADGRTRLVDFGIAKSLAHSAEALTQTGTVMGTLSAMAPEQLAGGPIGPRTDLYGVGVVLYEALSGRPPYATSSPLALAEAQKAGVATLEGVGLALAAIVAECLAYDPADRPLHAGALAASLRQAAEGGSGAVPWVSAAADTSAVTQPILVPPTTGAVDAPAPRHRAVRRLVAIFLLLAVLVLGGAVLAALVSDPVDVGVDASAPASTPLPPTAVPSALPPTAVPIPAWIDRLSDKVHKECDDATAAEADAAMLTMSEADAKRYADDLAKDCKEGRRGRGGG